MLKYEELNETQQGLYDKLRDEIKKGKDGNITPILEEIKTEGVLKEVLTTANIKIDLSNGENHTLTPLAYAMGFSNQKVIKNILDVIKDKAILEAVLTTANISLKFKNGAEHDITLLAHATILYNQEVIKNILDVAEKNNMLEKVFASIKKDHLNKTKNILEILKNQEQDEEQKAKIDGWLKILAKSISSCESKDDTNKIKWKEEVNEIFHNQEQEDWQVTLKRIMPNHKNKDIYNDVLKEILDSSSKDPQHIADRLTVLKKIMSGCESQKQSSVAESSVPQTEGNITDESSTSEISIMPDCERNEQSSMAESIVPKTEGNITDESSTSEIESSKQKDKVKTTNKPIIIGCVYGAIAALATGGGCFAAGVALPILALIGIAIAAALVTGLVAGGITYVISKPSENLDIVNVGQGVVDTGVNITE